VTCSAERLAFSRTAKSLLHRSAKFVLIAILAALGSSVPARAHVGSPDVYADGNAGPYRLFVTVRPPLVIPGIAEIEVRAQGSGFGGPTISDIEIAPIPLVGEASKHPPTADLMKRSAGEDRQFYTGSLWIMASGSWQIRFIVKGSWGDGVLSIPVPATSSSTQGMQTGLGVLLGSLGLLLVVGVIGIVGAAARDAQLPPGAVASRQASKRARIAMGGALVLMIAAVWFGNQWWKSEADNYARYVYKPLNMQAVLMPDHTLDLKIEDPGWIKSRKLDDFVLDHDHLMHLYLIRQPGMDVVYHLHPEQIAPGEFQLALPSIPAGLYNLYADVVHATGFPETLVARLELPEIAGRALAGDDAKGMTQPLSSLRGEPNACPVNPVAGLRFHLPDGYTMVWDNATKLPAKTPQTFEFSLLGTDGKPASDMALYMGMTGHAAFVKEDGSVFAHVHPSGTVSMAALMMATAQNQPKDAAMASMPGMAMPDSKGSEAPNGVPNTVGFPYGFPTAGAYRIFVQMKHGQTIETAAFDACAGSPLTDGNGRS
jgi:hypothetical protein